MESLAQIVHLLDGFRLSKIDIIDSQDSTSRFTEFYRLIKSDVLTTDEEAALHFYPNLPQTKRDQDYRKFKSQFKERLLNTIFFLDSHNKNVSEYQNAFVDAQKMWAATSILYNRHAIYSATEISERLLTLCIHYEFTELILQVTDKLKTICGHITGDRNKYNYYREVHFKALEDYNAELKAKDLMQSIRINYTKTAAYQKDMYEKAEKAIEELIPLKEKCSTYTFMLSWYLLNLAKYQTRFDNKNTIEICEEGIAHFQAKKYVATTPIAIFMNQKLIGQIQLRQYEAGRVTADEVLKLQREGTHNWYKTLEQHVMLAFHTKEYEEAYRVYQIAKNHRDFKYLKGANLEIWQLYAAYLVFVIKIGKIPNFTLANSYFKSFKINKFLNEVPQFGNDKKGMNIPTLIIQYVLQLTEKNREQLVERLEAIEQYLKRHLKSDEAVQRSRSFLKLLLELTKVNYSRKLIAPKAETLLEEINSLPLDIMEQGDRIEIMPFEYLWEDMLPLLQA